MRVLICDAHVEWAKALALLLMLRDCEAPVLVGDVPDTRRVARVMPDAILLRCEFGNPVIALEPLRVLALDRACRHIPVILITNSQTRARRALLEGGLGVAAILEMPFRVDALIAPLAMVAIGQWAHVN